MDERWLKVSQPPITALKKIKGGRLTGFTDINPQFRYKIMTDIYGLCGIGWKFEILNKWVENATDDQIFAFVEINIFIKVNDSWSDGIPGLGGSMLIAKEAKGLHSNDEAYKMALTDALGTAMKMIGVASAIYEGRWDGSKYKDTDPAPLAKTITIGKDNVNWLVNFCNKHCIEDDHLKRHLQTTYKFDPYSTTPEEFEPIKAKMENDIEVVTI
jgi:hypothetical protein